MKEARKHSRFCVQIYRHQINSGKYYLHEHPMDAKSWKESGMVALIKKEYNILTRTDQCQYVSWIKNKSAWTEATKKPKFLTNSYV